MTGIIIATIGFTLSIIALIIALIAKNKEIDRLKEEANKKWCDRFFIQPRYDIFRKFVVVSNDDLRALTIKEIQEAEAEGYTYDADESFPTILCFKKHVKVEAEDENKDQP